MDNRDEFEQWLLAEQHLKGTWNFERNCYSEFPCHLAFKAWQAARNDAWLLRKQAEIIESVIRSHRLTKDIITEKSLINKLGRLRKQADEAENG